MQEEEGSSEAEGNSSFESESLILASSTDYESMLQHSSSESSLDENDMSILKLSLLPQSSS